MLFNLTKEEALEIREWRCADGATWRKIAELASVRWPNKNIVHGHQIYGMELCKEAALLLNEEPNSEEWN